MDRSPGLPGTPPPVGPTSPDGVRPPAQLATPSEPSPADDERWVAEPGQRRERTPAQRDRARVLHSAALRRLASKTQVVLAGQADFPRTRLTHTLECAQIGRDLAYALGADSDVVETGCLAHDLGHPPFGHSGEAALDEIAAPVGGFEGNAQTFRILTRLEAKRFDQRGRSVGLNLTRAGLDAATKYPWPRPATGGKFGVYDDDLEAFTWMRAGAPAGMVCLEAQLMDWSDDVAYSVHDLEDAVYAGWLDLHRLRDPGEQRELIALTVTRTPHTEPDELAEALRRLLALDYWPDGFDGSMRALAALKNLTSQLIGRFCLAAESATRQVYGDKPLRRYHANLIVPRAARLECELLKSVADRYVMQPRRDAGAYQRERLVVADLVEAIWSGAPDRLEPWAREAWVEAADEPARLRVVLDQVASYTDTSALSAHQALSRRSP